MDSRKQPAPTTVWMGLALLVSKGLPFACKMREYGVTATDRQAEPYRLQAFGRPAHLRARNGLVRTPARLVEAVALVYRQRRSHWCCRAVHSNIAAISQRRNYVR